MFQKIKEKKLNMQKDWHDKFADFKKTVRASWDKKFPKPIMDMDPPLPKTEKTSLKADTFSMRRMVTFRLIG
jgi:hypothetical protein